MALQGFTAVFGVFVVPIPKEISRFNIDDSPEQVASTVRRRLGTRFGKDTRRLPDVVGEDDEEPDRPCQKKTRAN